MKLNCTTRSRSQVASTPFYFLKIDLEGCARMITEKKQTYKQLLASTLRENADSYLINELIDRYPNPVSLVDATEQELLNIKDIGVSKAKQIIAAVQLVQEFDAPSPKPIIIRSPSDVFSLMEFDLRYASKELFVCLFLSEYQKSYHCERSNINWNLECYVSSSKRSIQSRH